MNDKIKRGGLTNKDKHWGKGMEFKKGKTDYHPYTAYNFKKPTFEQDIIK